MLDPHSIVVAFPHVVTLDCDLTITGVGPVAAAAGFHSGMVLTDCLFVDTDAEPLTFRDLTTSLGAPLSLVPPRGQILKGTTFQSRPDRIHLLLDDLSGSLHRRTQAPPARLTGLLGIPASASLALSSERSKGVAAAALGRSIGTMLGASGLLVAEAGQGLVGEGSLRGVNLPTAESGVTARGDGEADFAFEIGSYAVVLRLPWPYDLAPLHLAHQALLHQLGLWMANQEIARRADSMKVRFRVLAEQTSDTLLMLSEEGVIIDASAIDDHPLTGMHIRELVATPDPVTVDGLVSKVREGEPASCEVKLRMGDPGRTYRLRLAPCDGSIAAVLHDETQQIEREAALVAARAEAKAAAEARSAFVRTVSHEMRTPLNALVGMTELARTSSGPERDYYLERVSAGTDRLYRLVEGTLDVSRIQAGELHLRPEPLELAELIQNCAADFEGVEVSLQMVTPELELDPIRARQVIEELLANAMTFGSAPVRLTALVRQNDTHGQVTIVVQDSGPGISPKDRERIFEPYIRLNHEDSEGVGLGLSIARAVCRAMKGDLTVEDSDNGARLVATWTAPLIVRELPAVLVVGVMPDAVAHELDFMAESGTPIEYATDAPAALRAARQRSFGQIFIDTEIAGVPAAALAQILRGVTDSGCIITEVDRTTRSDADLLDAFA